MFFVPGRITKSKRPSTGRVTHSANGASRRKSVKLEMRGRRTMATRSAVSRRRRAASSRQTPSSGSSSISRAIGKTPRHGRPVRVFEDLHAVANRLASPRNRFTANDRNSASLGIVEQAIRADDRREDAAAVDVGDQQPGAFRRRASPRLHRSWLLQIHLRHAARALDHDVFEARRQPLVRRQHALQQEVEMLVVFARRQSPPDPAVEHDLAARSPTSA